MVPYSTTHWSVSLVIKCLILPIRYSETALPYGHESNYPLPSFWKCWLCFCWIHNIPFTNSENAIKVRWSKNAVSLFSLTDWNKETDVLTSIIYVLWVSLKKQLMYVHNEVHQHLTFYNMGFHVIWTTVLPPSCFISLLHSPISQKASQSNTLSFPSLTFFSLTVFRTLF